MMSTVQFRRGRVSGRREAGYILLTLMMMCSMIIITLAAVLPYITQQIKRDREEELIHRGVQYSRAIRKFYKKTGRYPVRIEELENTNNIRYLRKRYKDPITGEDFKLLHYGEVKMTFGAGLAGGVAPGALGAGALGSQGGLNGQAGANGLQNQLQAQMAMQAQTQMVAQASATNNANGTNLNGSSSGDQSDDSGDKKGSNSGNKSPFSGGGPGGQTFGGGPIVGVVSTSKKDSVRTFNKKSHYKDWQFIYDPNSDRGGLLNTPAQPPLQNTVTSQGQGQGQPGMPGSSPFGGPAGNQPFGGQPMGGISPQSNQPQQQPPPQ